jgi:glycosyltransferase involved in cell wall biosynthesis
MSALALVPEPGERVDPQSADLGTVSLAHDYLNQRGGAERVALELAQMWPRAPLYTALYRPQSTYPDFRDVDVRTSYVDGLPVDRGFRALFPLYASAFRRLGPVGGDVLISSSSGWAHMLRAEPGTFHAVYCHNPARWLYGESYMGSTSWRQRMIGPALHHHRHLDQDAAHRADLYIANSFATRRRIRATYGIDAAVVPPPVDVDRFRPRPRGERLLVVSRLLPYKRVDIVVDAASRAGIGLDVVGDGPSLGDLRARAGSTVTFHGRLDDASVSELMEHCSALCLPGAEDFGMTPVEANAAGKPVIAFARGGAMGTIDEGFSGVFFDEQKPNSFLEAYHRLEELESSPHELALIARRFSRSAFRVRLLMAIENAMAQRLSAPR